MLGGFSDCREGTEIRHCGRNTTLENFVTSFELNANTPQIEEWWLKQGRGPKGRYVRAETASRSARDGSRF